MADFVLLEALLRSRVRLSLEAVQRMLLLGLIALLSVALLAGSVFAAMISAAGESAAVGGSFACVTAALVSGAIVTVEWTFGGKRFLVSRSAHRALLRALDASALDLLACSVLLRATPTFAVWQFGALGWAIGVSGRVPAALLTVVVAAPSVAFAVHVALTAFVAASAGGAQELAVTAVALGAIVFAAATPAAAHLHAVVSGGGIDRSGAPGMVLVVAVTSTGLAACVCAVISLRRVARATFPVEGASSSGIRTVGIRSALVRQSGRALWTGIVARFVGLASAVLALALLTRGAGVDLERWLVAPLPATTVATAGVAASWMPVIGLDLVRQVMVGVLASLGFVLMETTLGYIGPGRAQVHLRSAYEAGASRTGLVVAIIVTNLRSTVAVSILVALAYLTMTGDRSGAATLVATVVLVAAAALLADAAVAPARRPDGSSDRTIVTAFVSTCAAAPFLALSAISNDHVAVVGSCGGAIILLGGAAWTLARRIRWRSN